MDGPGAGVLPLCPPAQGRRWGGVTLIHPGSTGPKRPAFPLWPPPHEPAACWTLPNPSSLPCPHRAPSPPPPFLPEFPRVGRDPTLGSYLPQPWRVPTNRTGREAGVSS